MYFAMTVLHMDERQYWTTSFGLLLDLHTCHLQMLEQISGGDGAAPRGIDEIIPNGI